MLPKSLFLILACALLASAPIATVTTGGYLQVNGKALPTTGAPTWPLASGDEVVTAADTAVLSFPDGVNMTLGPNTRIVLRQCERCVVQLFEGSLAYKMPAISNVEVCALGHPIRPTGLTEGTITIESPEKVVVRVAGQEQVVTRGACACEVPPAWLTRRKAVLLVVVAAAGTTAVVIGVTRKPAPRSPK